MPEQPMPHLPHLPRYAVTGDAWDTLQHQITRLCRPPDVAARLNPIEDAAVLEYQRSRLAEAMERREEEGSLEMSAELRASLDKHGSVAEWHDRRCPP